MAERSNTAEPRYSSNIESSIHPRRGSLSGGGDNITRQINVMDNEATTSRTIINFNKREIAKLKKKKDEIFVKIDNIYDVLERLQDSGSGIEYTNYRIPVGNRDNELVDSDITYSNTFLNIPGSIIVRDEIRLTSLTEGQIVFPDSSGSLDGDSNLFWDNTNKRIGIGTDEPQVMLQINESTANLGTDWVDTEPTVDAVAITATNASLDLVSTDAATWGSTLSFKQVDGTTFENTWSIIRQTNGGGDGDGSLHFKYGTEGASYQNTTYLKINTDGTLNLTTCANAGTDTDKFLVLDASNNVDYRTGAELISDIGASADTHLHDGDTLELDGVNSDGGAFSFATSGDVTFSGHNVLLDTGYIDAKTYYYLNGSKIIDLDGTDNLLFGIDAGTNNSGSYNTIIGKEAGKGGSSYNASFNVFVGSGSGYSIEDGANSNVGVGYTCLYNISSGAGNTCGGYGAGNGVTSGSNNTLYGINAGKNLSTTDGAVCLGYAAGYYETEAGRLYITNQAGASEANGRAKSIIYGVMNSTTADQELYLHAQTDIGVGGSEYTRIATDGAVTVSTNNASALTIGNGAAGIDYILKFDGETNDGTITYMEDEDRFDVSPKIKADGGLQTDNTLVYNGETNVSADDLNVDVRQINTVIVDNSSGEVDVYLTQGVTGTRDAIDGQIIYVINRDTTNNVHVMNSDYGEASLYWELNPRCGGTFRWDDTGNYWDCVGICESANLGGS